MKINSISKTNFSGLFTDKSSRNGGNWRMEYSPYSWEGKMAPKVQFEHIDFDLPDNEEVFCKIGKRETSKDILGTTSYIRDIGHGQDYLRKTITEMPSMTLAESLAVKDKKLAKFLELKQQDIEESKEVLEQMPSLFDISKEHNHYLSDLKENVFFRNYSKEYSIKRVNDTFDEVVRIAEETGNAFRDYIKLTESYRVVRLLKEKIHEELEKITKAADSGTLIDISRRDLELPNEPLVQAFKNLEKVKGKLVALSHRTISVDEILKFVGKDFDTKKAINFVEDLMKRRA